MVDRLDAVGWRDGGPQRDVVSSAETFRLPELDGVLDTERQRTRHQRVRDIE